MKTIISLLDWQPACIFVTLISFQVCFAQTPPPEYISRAGLNKLIFKKFSSITNGVGTNNTMVSYASLDPLNGNATFNCTAPLSKDAANNPKISLLSLKLTGDLLSDNSIVLFKDAKINTGISFNGQYHWGLKKNPGNLVYLDSYSVRLNQERRTLDYQRKLDSSNLIVIQQSSLELVEILGRLKTKKVNDVVELRSQIDQLKTTTGSSADTILKRITKLRNLNIEIQKIDYQIDSIGQSVRDRSYINGEIRQAKLDEKYRQKRLDLESDPAFDKLKFCWMSANVGFSRKEYHSFYRSAVLFQNQVITKDFYTYNLGLTFNYFSEGSSNMVGLKPENRRSFYINAGVSYQRDNNTSLLKTTEISEERVFKNGAGDTVRKIAEKYNAYTDSIITSDVITISANFYWNHRSGNVSFHLFPSLDNYVKGSSLVNIGIGILTSFKNAKKESPAVTTELYVQMLDLTNQLHRSNFLSTGQIGIKFSHAFNFFR